MSKLEHHLNDLIVTSKLLREDFNLGHELYALWLTKTVTGHDIEVLKDMYHEYLDCIVYRRTADGYTDTKKGWLTALSMRLESQDCSKFRNTYTPEGLFNIELRVGNIERVY